MSKLCLAMLFFGLLASSCVRASSSEPVGIQLYSDISTSCFFTVNRVREDNVKTYRVISSSPRDCGKVDRQTGRVLAGEVDLHCPSGYSSIGLPRGGPVGSNDGDIFYRVEGFCGSNHYIKGSALKLLTAPAP